MRRRSFRTASTLRPTSIITPGLATLALACSTSDARKLDREKLLDPETCAECHEDHYKEWSGSMHAYAADDPVFLAMNRRGQDETNDELGAFCVKCHAPMAVEEGALDDFRAVEELPRHLKGVTCYFCHNVASVEDTHNNPLVLANDTTMRGNVADPVESPAHDAEYSRLLDGNAAESADLCGSCHDIQVPKEFSGATEDVHLERTFAEWREGFFGNGAEATPLSCAACHMLPVPGVPIANFEGVGVRTRNLHTFPAVDAPLTPFPPDDPEAQALQRKALLFEIDSRLLRAELSADQTSVRVLVDNAFTGHGLPSGATQDRRLWAEIRVFDPAGDVIFESGVLPDDATPVVDLLADDPRLWLFRAETYDRSGDEAHMFWNIAEIVTERDGEPLLIPTKITGEQFLPDGSPNPDFHRENLTRTFDIPGVVSRVELRMRLRPMGLEVLRDLVDEGYLEQRYFDAMPIFDVLPKRSSSDLTLEWNIGDATVVTGPVPP